MADRVDQPDRWELHVDTGLPGASARDEFERRLRRDAQRRRQRFGRLLAPIVALVAGVRPSTARWRIGGQAEERVGLYLSEAVGRTGVVLHDRSIPGRRANIDHIAVVPRGIWVVDTKCYRGPLRRARPPGRLSLRRTLVVNGYDLSQLLVAAREQRAVVQAAVGPRVPVCAVLCFTGADWQVRTRAFKVGGVTVTRPRSLARALRAPGPLGVERRAALATTLARAFPPYACAPRRSR